MNDQNLTSVCWVQITDPRSSYRGRCGKVVATYQDGDVRVTFSDKPHLELRFSKSEYQVEV